LYGSLSLNLALMILGGYFLGKLCEERYQWSNMTITGILTGLFFGLYQMFSFAYQATKKK
ncbi:MAG TPA: AtpZ/AtpI family protein, partial [Bacillota bacterium]